MRDVRFRVLQWVTGSLCAATGALMVVAPHHFGVSVYTGLQPGLAGWAGVFLLAGIALLGTVALTTRRSMALAAHLLGAVALVAMAVSLLQAGAWIGGVNYLVLGAALVATPLWASHRAEPVRPPAPSQDLLAGLVGLGGAITGLLLLTTPDQFSAPVYDAIRPFLAAYGVAYLVAGLALLAAQRRGAPAWLPFAASLLMGTFMLGFLVLVALPSRVWAGIAYFGGLGLVTALAPWLAPRLRALDPTALQTRLVFLLTTATALPLILTIALVTQQQEQIAIRQSMAEQQTLATVLAEDVTDVVGLHRAAVAGLAGRPGLLGLAPAEQAEVVRALGRAYPEVVTFSLYDRSGQALAHGDGRPLDALAGLTSFEQVRQTNQPSIRLLIDPHRRAPAIGLMEPIRAADGSFGGLVIGTIDPGQIGRLFVSAGRATGATILLVDGQGRVIAHAGLADIPILTDLSERPAVAALLASRGGSGTLRHGAGVDEHLASYAPVAGFAWGVTVETPVPVALASVQAGRELTFMLLAVVVAGAAIAGRLVAGWLTAPLAALGRAVEGLAADDARVPLPRAQLAEVRRLERGFDELRERLAARTAEQQQAEAGLRFLAEASRHLTSSLDYTETLGAVARLAVPDLADVCNVWLVEPGQPPRPVAVAHHDPSQEIVLAALHRYVPDPANPHSGVGRVLATNRPDLIEQMGDEHWQALARDAEHLRLLRILRPTSHLMIPLDARGRTLGVLSLIMIDSSGRRFTSADLPLAEEVARRAAQAIDNALLYRETLAAVRLREEFISIASHELRTPLTTIKGYVQLLARRLQRGSGRGEPIQPVVEQLQVQVSRLEALVTDLLEVSHLQAGRLALRAEVVDLPALASEVLTRFAQAPELTEQHHLTLDAPGPVAGQWDPGRLDQVLTNLIANALKYSPAGGEARVRITAAGGWAEIVVSDQGIGIPPAEQALIFQPFTRGQAARERFTGTGLGLYITAQIVARHGGDITVDSAPGLGSRFTIRLPLTSGLAGDGAAEGLVAQPIGAEPTG